MPRGTRGGGRYFDEFAKWLLTTKFSDWLVTLGKIWVVSPEELALEDLRAGCEPLDLCSSQNSCSRFRPGIHQNPHRVSHSQC